MSSHARRLSPLGTEGWVVVSEPLEAAFTMLMPEGWTHHAYLQREHGLNRIIAAATRDGGAAMVHVGDPRLSLFLAPNPFLDPMLRAFQPHVCYQDYTPADRFFPDYVMRQFRGAPGFHLASVTPSPRFLPIAATVTRQHPHAAITTAAVEFLHAIDGKPMRCRLHGATTGMPGGWLVDFVIASATEDLEAVENVAFRMMTSRQFHPGWMASQQRLHDHKMAMGAQQNQFIQNMTDIQAQGHQQRMRDIHASGQANTWRHEQRMAQADAGHQSWMASQAQNDAAHQSWMNSQSRDDAMQAARVNGIREEHTVIDGSGNAYQVDIHHDRYYVNTRDNTYIGAGAATERQDLRGSHGVNPDDYEEVRIVR